MTGIYRSFRFNGLHSGAVEELRKTPMVPSHHVTRTLNSGTKPVYLILLPSFSLLAQISGILRKLWYCLDNSFSDRPALFLAAAAVSFIHQTPDVLILCSAFTTSNIRIFLLSLD